MLKNLFIAAALSVGVCASASPRLPRASVPVLSNLVKAQIDVPQDVEHDAASRASTISFSYCGNPYSLYSLSGVNAGVCVAQLIELSADVAKDFSETEITAINIVNPTNNSYKNPINDVTVVIYTDLSAEPVYTQSVTLGTGGAQYSKITLDTPYVIKGDTPVYFGYEFTYQSSYSSVYYIVVDDGSFPAGHSFIGTGNGAGALQFINMEAMGLAQNLCISADAITSANVSGKANAVTLDAGMTAVAGEPFFVEIGVTNTSTEPLESVGISYEINGVEGSFTYELPTPLSFLKSDYIPFEPQTDATGFGVEMSAKVVTVNGKPNASEPINVVSTAIDMLEPGMGAQRSVVVEEGTGTWCQYCPRGYVLMEDVRNQFENYIGIAVHDSDNMATSTYSGFISKYIKGYPQYYVNRMVSPDLTDTPSDNIAIFSAYYNILTSWPAIATLDFETEVNEELGEIQVDATTIFGLSGSGDYRLAVVVKEDSVGPYRQTNAFYGRQGWGVFTTNSRPSLLYNDVAREAKTWNGISGSVPYNFVAGTPYEYRTSISSAKVSGGECDVVLMLINGADGSIEQAVSKHVQVHHDAAIDEISVAADASAEYFDINGRRLSAPGRGLTIVRTAAGTHKIMQ